jgi:hypothetical protein
VTIESVSGSLFERSMAPGPFKSREGMIEPNNCERSHLTETEGILDGLKDMLSLTGLRLENVMGLGRERVIHITMEALRATYLKTVDLR